MSLSENAAFRNKGVVCKALIRTASLKEVTEECLIVIAAIHAHMPFIVFFPQLSGCVVNFVIILTVHNALYMAIYCYANSKVAPPCESKKSTTALLDWIQTIRKLFDKGEGVIEPRHDKTNNIRPVWSESSLCA